MKGGLTEKLQQKGMEDAARTVEKYVEIVKRMKRERHRPPLKGGLGISWTNLDKEDECKCMMDMVVQWKGNGSAGSKYVECFWNMHSE